MKIKAYRKFQKGYNDLPLEIQKKTDKQLKYLAEDMKHPSLHVKKMQGFKNIWEARVDIYYRFTFEIVQDTIFLRVIGNHEDVLRNP